MDVNPPDADFRSLADEALRIQPGVRISTRTGDDRTFLVIEATGLSTAEVGRRNDALWAHRNRYHLVAEFVVVNSMLGGLTSRRPDMPSGWPPDGAS